MEVGVGEQGHLLGAADLVEGGAQEELVADAGQLNGVLEGEEDAFAGPFEGLHLEQVLGPELGRVDDLAARDFVVGVAGDDLGEGALAGAVGPHDGMYLAGLHLEVDAAEDLLAVDAGVEVLDVEQVHGGLSMGWAFS